MIAIENTRVITYGNNQSVTVYRDFSDTNLWYIVPEPVIPRGDDNLPEFALVNAGDGGKVAGTCPFQAELNVSPDALAAVQSALGAGARFAQFDWQSVNAVFIFSTATMAGMELTATPSMYGANRASFIVHLPDQATVNDFINAFGPGGSGAGTFMLRYDVTALTRLPPVSVTVQFNSSAAYEFQRTVSESKNVWGNVTSRTVAVHEHLAQSEAGTISVDRWQTARSCDPAETRSVGQRHVGERRHQVVGAALVLARPGPTTSRCHKSRRLPTATSRARSFVDHHAACANPGVLEGRVEQVFSVVPNQDLAVACSFRT